MKIISGYYGAQPSGVYSAPKKTDCYFFSNNVDVGRTAEAAGWSFIFDDVPPSADFRISSLQSKKTKFLQFDKQSIDFSPLDSILYFDHKFNVELSHVQRLETLCKSDMLVTNTPREKTCIQDEVNEAVSQPRYRETMHQTLDWARNKIYDEDYSPNNRIMRTGLLLYSRVSVMQPLCDEVYDTCWLLGQPECQIIWGILAQRYELNLTRVAHDTVPILHKEPSI